MVKPCSEQSFNKRFPNGKPKVESAWAKFKRFFLLHLRSDTRYRRKISVVRTLSDVIIVAIITGICSVAGQWLISRKQSQDRAVAEAERETRLDMRLQGVEKRLDEHNNYASKIGSIQTDIAVIKNEIKNLKESA